MRITIKFVVVLVLSALNFAYASNSSLIRDNTLSEYNKYDVYKIINDDKQVGYAIQDLESSEWYAISLKGGKRNFRIVCENPRFSHALRWERSFTISHGSLKKRNDGTLDASGVKRIDTGDEMCAKGGFQFFIE